MSLCAETLRVCVCTTIGKHFPTDLIGLISQYAFRFCQQCARMETWYEDNGDSLLSPVSSSSEQQLKSVCFYCLQKVQASVNGTSYVQIRCAQINASRAFDGSRTMEFHFIESALPSTLTRKQQCIGSGENDRSFATLFNKHRIDQGMSAVPMSMCYTQNQMVRVVPSLTAFSEQILIPFVWCWDRKQKEEGASGSMDIRLGKTYFQLDFCVRQKGLELVKCYFEMD